jgi:hypothetical protein
VCALWWQVASGEQAVDLKASKQAIIQVRGMSVGRGLEKEEGRKGLRTAASWVGE